MAGLLLTHFLIRCLTRGIIVHFSLPAPCGVGTGLLVPWLAGAARFAGGVAPSATNTLYICARAAWNGRFGSGGGKKARQPRRRGERRDGNQEVFWGGLDREAAWAGPQDGLARRVIARCESCAYGTRGGGRCSARTRLIGAPSRVSAGRQCCQEPGARPPFRRLDTSASLTTLLHGLRLRDGGDGARTSSPPQRTTPWMALALPPHCPNPSSHHRHPVIQYQRNSG